jgi:PleD family two-component response regulator
MLDAGPRQATKLAETIRQGIEHLVFLRNGEEIRLTACSGVTEIQPDNGYIDVFDRLEAAVQHAKRSGPNRCSQYSPSAMGAEAVESPNFGIEDLEIVI